jgi:Fur family ferric uptake transcriptional regulator
MTLYDTLVEIVKNQGERLTIQRQLVIEALAQTGEHMTIQKIGQYIIHQHGTAQTIPEPTIYRIVQWLKAIELVSQTDIAEAGIVYQVIGTSKHHHLICLTCGNIQDIDDTMIQPLRNHLLNQHGFLPRIDHMAFYGICHACQSKSR